jgi:hypothetical protein
MHRLREFDVVAVSLPEAGPLHNTAFNSHILAIAGSTVALEPVSRPQVTWLPEHVQDAFVTFMHKGSLIALKGSLSMRGSVGDLRFKVTDRTRADRRKATRVNACLPVSLHFTDSETRAEGLTVRHQRGRAADRLRRADHPRKPARGHALAPGHR